MLLSERMRAGHLARSSVIAGGFGLGARRALAAFVCAVSLWGRRATPRVLGVAFAAAVIAARGACA